jgi:hypothetical protein
MSIYVIIARITPTATDSVRPSPTMSTSSSVVVGYPTTTGEPNCFFGTGFDGTVNDNFLILCDTDLPDFDLDTVDALNLAECIEQCASYVPGGNGITCVAVEYDIVSVNPVSSHSELIVSSWLSKIPVF